MKKVELGLHTIFKRDNDFLALDEIGARSKIISSDCRGFVENRLTER